MKVRNISLTDLVSQFKNWDSTLGPEELKILSDADMLLQVTIPQDEFGRLAYLSKSAQIQGQLNNLLSRLSYIWRMTIIERDSFWGELIESGEAEGRDKRYVSLNRNPKFRDMEETVAALETIRDHVNSTSWLLKTIAGRL